MDQQTLPNQTVPSSASSSQQTVVQQQGSPVINPVVQPLQSIVPNKAEQTLNDKQVTEDMQNEGTYSEKVGGSLIDLLLEVSVNENLMETIAKEMKLTTAQVRDTVKKLLDKIDQGEVTQDEIALIMTVPMVELPPDTAQ